MIKKLNNLQKKLETLEKEAEITRNEMAKLESDAILKELKEADILLKFQWEFKADDELVLDLISERSDKLERELDDLVGRNTHHETINLTDHIYIRYDDNDTRIGFSNYIANSVEVASEEVFYQFIKDFKIKIGFKSLDENIKYTEKKLEELKEKKKNLVERLKSVL